MIALVNTVATVVLGAPIAALILAIIAGAAKESIKKENRR